MEYRIYCSLYLEFKNKNAFRTSEVQKSSSEEN